MSNEKITTNFFSQLDKMLGSKNAVILNVLKNDEGNMTIAITNVVMNDEEKEVLPAISISGPVNEIDTEFFTHMAVPAEKIKGLQVNTADVEEGIADLKKEIEEDKVPKKSTTKAKSKTSAKAKVKEKAEPVMKEDPKKKALELAAEGHKLFEERKYNEAVIKYRDAADLNPKDKNIQEGLKKAEQWSKASNELYSDEATPTKATVTEIAKESPNIHIVKPTPDVVVEQIEEEIQLDLMDESNDELPI